MGKLTNEMRRSILHKAMAGRYDKQEESLNKQEDKVARKGHAQLFDAALMKKVNAVPENWFRKDNCLRFNVGGQTHWLSMLDGAELKVPYSTHCGLLGVIEGELAEEFHKLANDRKALEEEKRTTEAKLSSLLYSINTYKRLSELWPEGKKFYEHYDFDSNDKTSLPAIQFNDINKMLGLK